MSTEFTNEYGVSLTPADNATLQKSAASINKQAVSALKKEKLKKHQTLQQVIAARQEKIYEQQCEIDALQRRIRSICNDNKYLREQNYWQTKALEKLDGKHAELPQIINGHLEEIKVFREQIKRMKEVLKSEKQRRQEAEAANERAFVELKHLRKLAEEQNLLEKEELMRTIEKLQQETEERERLLLNLERYAENLEKNQRFESLRHAKTQKEMRETCQSLLNRIQALEQTVQEKQKIIELGNIYSKRANKPPKRTDSSCLVGSTEAVTLATDHKSARLGHQTSQLDFRGAEKVMVRKDKNRKKRTPVGYGDRVSADEFDGEPEREAHPNLSHGTSHGQMDHLSDTEQHLARLHVKRDGDVIVLPKIGGDVSESQGEGNEKRSKCTHDNKQVRFSASEPDAEKMFQQLRISEQEARLSAEKHLRDSSLISPDHSAGNLNESAELDAEAVKKILMKQESTDQTSDHAQDIRSNQDMPTAKSPISDRGHMTSPLADETDMGQTYPCSRASSAPALLNSPQVSRTASDVSVLGVADLIPIEETIKQICRPCGDQELDDFFIADTCGDSSSDTMATGTAEDYLWNGTPSNNAGSSARSSRIAHQNYQGASGFPTDPREELTEVGVGYATEMDVEFDPAKTTEHGDATRTSLPIISCAIRTKTLYSMNTNRKQETNKKLK